MPSSDGRPPRRRFGLADLVDAFFFGGIVFFGCIAIPVCPTFAWAV